MVDDYVVVVQITDEALVCVTYSTEQFRGELPVYLRGLVFRRVAFAKFARFIEKYIHECPVL